MSEALFAELARVVGETGVLCGGDRHVYRKDASTYAGVDPVAVVFPRSADQVEGLVRVARRFATPIVTRGAGTGLAGGAVVIERSIVLVTTRMRSVLNVDTSDRIAWVEPGVLNLDLQHRLAEVGHHFAPDPSSQQACTLGGNVANNSGGPHCLASGVTTAHVAALHVIGADGVLRELGGVDPEPAGLDLRGLMVGSEGTLGIVTAIAVRLTPNPRGVATVLASFDDLDLASDAVSAVIAAGIVPAALEMMDGPLAAVVEDFVHAGFPTEAAAVLLVELDGSPASVADDVFDVTDVLQRCGATTVATAADEAQRAGWWKGRKSAFGAIARIRPDYYLHDTVVPRTMLTPVLRQIREAVAAEGLIVHNVFHAGDGNLHPLVLFDAREPGVMERVHRCGDAIVAASLAAGGVLSGEHGIGIEKRDHMGEQFDEVSLEVQEWARAALDPDALLNPSKILPAGRGCGDIADLPDGVWI